MMVRAATPPRYRRGVLACLLGASLLGAAAAAARLPAASHALLAAAAPARPKVKIWQEPIPPRAADPFAPDRAEAGTAEAIAALTGSLRFLPPGVAYLPAAPGVPSPATILGHVAGAPEIGRAADVHRYFRRLAAASDRVRVQAIGSSEEGREILLATVSAAHNLAELSYFREAAARLADPRRTPPEEAERLAAGGKLLYYVVGGTQPGELASPEMLAELAYRLAVSERPEARAVREQMIVLITPVAEPDAYDRAVEWYRRNLRQQAGLPWVQLSEILAPPYAGHYGGARWAGAGDSGLGLASTRAIAEAFFGFHPQVLQGLGTSPPLLSLGGAAAAGTAAPEAPADTAARTALAAGADPWPALAAAVGAALRGFGLPGVRDGTATDAADQRVAADRQAAGAPRPTPAAVELALDHNAAAGEIGVFGNGTAGEYEREVGVLEAAPVAEPGAGTAAAAAGGAAADPAADRGAAGGGRAPGAPPNPRGAGGRRGRGARQPPAAQVRAVPSDWPPGGRTRWSLRDGVNYAESATLAALGWAAGHRRELLAGSWQRGARAWREAGGGPPFAWIFPARQSDPDRLAAMLRRLLGQRLEVHRLREDLALAGRRFAAGSYVVRLDQPYRQAALRFLGGRSRARDGGDGGDGGNSGNGGNGGNSGDGANGRNGAEQAAIPWPLLYGVEGSEIGDRAVLDAAMEPVSAVPPPPPGRVGRIVGAEPPVAGEAAGQALPMAGEASSGVEMFLLRDTGQLSLVAAQLALERFQVDAAETAFTAGGVAYPAGSWLVQTPRFALAAVAERLGLTFAAAAAPPTVPRHVVHLPRLGVLHGWTDAEPSGWLRAGLDRERVPYSLVSDEEVRRGGLGARFDLLILAGADADWRRRLRGIDPRWSPLPFSRAAEFPSHGVPDGAADVTGGLGEPGLQELRRFVAGGGVLVTLGNASELAAASGLGAALARVAGGTVAGDAESLGPAASGDAAAAAGTGEAGGGAAAVAPAPEPAVEPATAPVEPPAGPATAPALDPPAELRASVVLRDHPVVYGYPDLTQVLRRGGPLLHLPPAAAGRVVLRFGAGGGTGPAAAPMPAIPAIPAIEVEDIEPGAPAAAAAQPPAPPTEAEPPMPQPLGAADGSLVLAGRLSEPASAVDGSPAIVDLPVGRGHLVLFAFDPFDPALGPADLRFVYNLLLNWHALPP
jgi:hypothetical protein